MGDLARMEVTGLVPASVLELGKKAERTFVEFFVAHLSNDHTRRAYAHAAGHLSDWLAGRGWSLAELEPIGAATYIESLKKEGKATSTIKARLSALRNLCDYMASRGVLEWNPFSVVRAPWVSAGEGKTPILGAEDVRALFGSIGTEDVVDLRDRAILSLMLYTFARVGAMVKVDGRHYEAGTALASIALYEKRGRFHRVPCHHQLHEAMEASPSGHGLVHPSSGSFRCRGGGTRTSEGRMRRAIVRIVEVFEDRRSRDRWLAPRAASPRALALGEVG